MRRQFKISIKGGIFLFLLFCLKVKGQTNLVLNPSFELHSGCSGFDVCSFVSVTDWCTPTEGSPDWFNTCTGPQHSVPQNMLGYQYARTGSSYGGFVFIINPTDAFEYVEGQFSQSLKSWKRYCVTFYVSLADSADYATGAIGAYISKSQIPCNPFYPDTLQYTPQIENPLASPIIDKKNWVPVSGEYTAAGGEKYITIGSFDSTAPYVFVSGGSPSNNVYGQTYYYLDDVSVREIISAHAGLTKDTTICKGEAVLIGADTATAGISYHWMPLGGLANPNTAQTLASPSVTTTYTLTVVNDSMKGCNCPDSVSMDSITIKVDSVNLSVTPNQTICFSDTVILRATGASNYIWNTGNTSSSIKVSPIVTTTYTCSAASNGCSDSAITTVMVDKPTISVCCDTTIVAGGNADLSVSGNGSYIWSPPTGLNCDTCLNVIASPNSTTTYTVTITDSNGCSINQSVMVTVKPAETPCGELFVPDAFSPNGDGQNDVFYVRDNCVATFHLIIYDRWGEKVFESENIDEGWDGKYRGQPENAGTYVYYLQGTYTDGNSFSKKGNIALVR